MEIVIRWVNAKYPGTISDTVRTHLLEEESRLEELDPITDEKKKNGDSGQKIK